MQPTSFSPLGWAAFGAVVLCLLAVDLFSHRGQRGISRRSAIVWSLVWVSTALAFNAFIWATMGAEPAEEFFAAWLLEKSLSVDNLFVFLVLFASLGIPREQQRRVLSWGIFGALVTRALFIGVGAVAIQRWHGILYAFGALLIFAGLKMLRAEKREGEGRLLGFLRARLPLTRELHGEHFVVRERGRLVGTPLLLALVAVELTDVFFAVDSIPAAFAVTESPFIVYSSNVFAILGLRALYSLLSDALSRLRYLRHGLAAVLCFAGVKMLAARWIHLPPLASIGVIVACVAGAVVASLIANRRERGAQRGNPASVGADPPARAQAAR